MLNRLLFTIEHAATTWDWQVWAGVFACLYLVAFVFLTVFRGRR
jgi:hypothetical protein